MAKLIYKPKGAAGEYAAYAVNFVNGCSNDCSYCYNKSGVVAKTLGGNKVTWKKVIEDAAEKAHRTCLNMAYNMFCKDVDSMEEELKREGIFFNFVSDPFLDETRFITMECVDECILRGIPVTVLTKMYDAYLTIVTLINCEERSKRQEYLNKMRKYLKVGFTLTGCDEEEPGASPNDERIIAMSLLKKEYGLYTWASIEPILDLSKSAQMIVKSLPYCDEYRIGLVSGRKRPYSPSQVMQWKNDVERCIGWLGYKKNIVWKSSVMEYIKKIDK